VGGATPDVRLQATAAAGGVHLQKGEEQIETGSPNSKRGKHKEGEKRTSTIKRKREDPKN